MRKTDKKLDNALRLLLTGVCEAALDQHSGFQWLTHQVNFNRFPGSLLIICVFDTNEHLGNADLAEFRRTIAAKLASIEIKLKDPNTHIQFDTEENCALEHNGNWNERLRQH